MTNNQFPEFSDFSPQPPNKMPDNFESVFGTNPNNSRTNEHPRHRREAEFLISLLTDNEVTPAERRRAEAYLNSCGECRQLYRQYTRLEQNLRAYIHAAPPTPPPLPSYVQPANRQPAARPAFAAGRRGNVPTRPRPVFGFVPVMTLAGMAAAVLLVVITVVILTAGLQTQNESNASAIVAVGNQPSPLEASPTSTATPLPTITPRLATATSQPTVAQSSSAKSATTTAVASQTNSPVADVATAAPTDTPVPPTLPNQTAGNPLVPLPATTKPATATPTTQPVNTPVQSGVNPVASVISGATGPVATQAASQANTATATSVATATVAATTAPTPTQAVSAIAQVSPSVVAVNLPTVTATATPTFTAAPVVTIPPPSAPPTYTPTSVALPTNTATSTALPTSTATSVALPTNTATSVALPTNTPTSVATSTATPAASPTATVVVSPTATPAATVAATPTITATLAPTATVIVTTTVTTTPTVTATVTVTPTVTLVATATAQPDLTATAQASITPKPTGPTTPLIPGWIAFINKNDGEIYVTRSDGTQTTALTSGSAGRKIRWQNLAWSNSGSKLAAVARNLDSGISSIYLFQPDVNNMPVLITQGIAPVWSPNDNSLAFLSGTIRTNGNIQSGLPAVVNLGAKTFTQLSSEYSSLPPQWFDDGSKLLIGQNKIYDVNSKVSSDFNIYENNCAAAGLSPNGNLLAVLEENNGVFTPLLYDLDSPVSQANPTTRFSKIAVSGKVGHDQDCGAVRINWTANNRYFYFYHSQGGTSETCLVDTINGVLRCLSNVNAPSFTSDVTAFVDSDAATGNLYVAAFGNRPVNPPIIAVAKDYPLWQPR